MFTTFIFKMKEVKFFPKEIHLLSIKYSFTSNNCLSALPQQVLS